MLMEQAPRCADLQLPVERTRLYSCSSITPKAKGLGPGADLILPQECFVSGAFHTVIPTDLTIQILYPVPHKTREYT